MSNLYCLPGRAGGSPGYARQGNTLDKIDKRARLFRRSAENRLPSCPIGGEVKEPTEHLTTAELLAVLRERLPEWPPIQNDESKIQAASGLHCKSSRPEIQAPH